MKKTETTEIVLEEKNINISYRGDNILICDNQSIMSGHLTLEPEQLDTLIKLLTEIKKYL